MDEFGLLTRDLGIRQPGKSAPTSASKPSSASYVGSRSADTNEFSDIFSGYKGRNPNLYPQLNSMPVYDDGVVFGSTSNGGHVVVDDILGSLGSDSKRSDDLGGFEELMPGFRGSSPPNKREPEINQQRSAVSSDESSADVSADPFAVFESTSSSAYPLPTDPLDNLGRSMDPGSSNVNASSANGGTFDDNDAFDGFAKSVPLFTSGKNESRKVKKPLESGPSRSVERYSRESFDNAIPRTRPTQSFDSSSSIQSPKSNDSSYERNDNENQSPRSSEHLERADDAWLTVSEIPLFTEPTRGPPPSRPPPPLVMKLKPYGTAERRRKEKENESYSPSTSINLHPEVSEFAELERDEGMAPRAQDLGDREQWEREERERVQKILAKEREVEREKARQERAREARERAVAEARAKAERAAFEKANTEARQRVVRAAAQRAAAEAREKALAEAREKAARERINAEARERAAAEAHLRAERERAAAAAAAAARERQYRAENDIESFFGMGAPPNSVPKHRATTSDQSRGSADGAWQTFSTSSPIRKTSTTTNIVDDLTSIFEGASSYGEFQEVEGESEDRRRARFERHQRTQERTLKALAEKNERDMQIQREQAERQRIAETLDIEIKRWAFGKEGNLRALLSTLHYVLWPECGWQPVSLTDLITAASVKKAYRKATLCIHPDKVQQKGATLQQKCIAEKVFDILKEAWNKFNSEELF